MTQDTQLWELGTLEEVTIINNFKPKTKMQKILDYAKNNKATVIIGGTIITVVAILIFKKK